MWPAEPKRSCYCSHKHNCVGNPLLGLGNSLISMWEPYGLRRMGRVYYKENFNACTRLQLTGQIWVFCSWRQHELICGNFYLPLQEPLVLSLRIVWIITKHKSCIMIKTWNRRHLSKNYPALFEFTVPQE
jgi:hypothetical protein